MFNRKTVLYTALGVTVAAVALRVLQYLFVTDAEGFFRPHNGFHRLLIYALTALLALAAVYALAAMASKPRPLADSAGIKCNALGFISALLGLVMLAEAGIAIGSAFLGGAITVAGILQVPAGAYFCLLAFLALSGSKPKNGTRVLGLFPAIYVVSYAINEFFDSFRDINLSKSHINMLALCSAALFVFALCGVFADMSVGLKRLLASAMLCTLFTCLSAFPEIIMLALGRASVDAPLTFCLQTAVKLLYAALAVTVLVKAGEKTEINQEEEQFNG